MSEKKTKKRDRPRNKKVVIAGPSVTINGKVYGASAMQTTYESSMALPDKDRVQAICAEAYMKLLALFTAPPLLVLPKSVTEPVVESVWDLKKDFDVVFTETENPEDKNADTTRE